MREDILSKIKISKLHEKVHRVIPQSSKLNFKNIYNLSPSKKSEQNSENILEKFSNKEK